MPSVNGHGPKTAILYARVSTKKQAEENHYSLPQQREALRSYCEREGYVVIEEVEDPGYSGASLKRSGMDWVRDLVADGDVSVVLAQDRDRYAREPAYLYLLHKEFAEHGTMLRALSDRGDDSPEGELTDGILDQLAKFERAKFAERTRRGKHRKRWQGRLVAGYTPGYGYRYNTARDGLEVDAGQMRTVRRIFEMMAQGASFYSVIRTLEREGISSPRGQERWNRPTIRNLILNDLYQPHTVAEVAELVAPEVAATLAPERRYGIAYYGKKQITKRQVSEGSGGKRRYRWRINAKTRDRGQWLAVPVPDSGLPRELVDAARESIRYNNQTSSGGYKTWEVSGGLIRCAECSHSMGTKTAGGGKAGRRLFYYRCTGRYKGQGSVVICSHKKHHRAEATEAEVWRLVVDSSKIPNNSAPTWSA